MSGCTAAAVPVPPQAPVLQELAQYLPQSAAPPEPPRAPVVPLLERDPDGPVLATRVLRAAVEILGKRRPAGQLAAVVLPRTLDQLTELRDRIGHLQPRLHRVLTTQPGPGVLEAVAVVVLNTGVRALAARFERPRPGSADAGWRCTHLQMRLTAGDVATTRR